MAEKRLFDFRLIRYVPNPVQGLAANIGVMLVEMGATATFAEYALTDDWRLARLLDPDLDVELLTALVREIVEELKSQERDRSMGGKEASRREWALQLGNDSLSNVVQIPSQSAMLLEDPIGEVRMLLRDYCGLAEASRGELPASGRRVILARMRDEFQRADVWNLMEHEIAISKYTRKGDPLKIDCGYRYPAQPRPSLVRDEQVFRMFHAVSLKQDVNSAKVLAFTYGDFRQRFEDENSVSVKLTAIVEDDLNGEEMGVNFAMETMKENGIAIAAARELPAFAARARTELKA